MGPLVVQEQELATLEQERQRILGRLQQPQPPALKSVVAVPQGMLVLLCKMNWFVQNSM